ncbi:hypothetical protein H257_16428 [Aphanomyces astaci]|uniref:ADP-ribosylation factor n=1 Tax=Aphanomyces astaci TaxID=112090 RepID=W4FKF2_APHAT|nr:hypothetical protein H257_16428 [Aphanomyces astaci]ETV67346.1 hypothetical protein H257_16428 [Aphanomyces astaci]KAF0704354.1 hypothetical protein AaE_014985 [Aphanomyces astaci]RHY10045.1 hypothetical protein DYB25_006750 [Aphanomyces astaci]RHY48080.1 hypothetical protein DYB30_012546 [Aphanomyces astaci]RHY71938.1 hypothetical protein DYB34_012990 [Aphanomyces astaci]|eukprot:XP_009843161.1 hypothetical protein H257_16428 [Aphanomyces astaci]
MGSTISRVWTKLFGKIEARLIMIGLDGVGKTTLLHQFRLGEAVTTTPTIGFNVEAVEFKNIKLNVWDLSGHEKIRSVWRTMCPNTQGVVFVVDSTDIARMDAAREELHHMLWEDHLRDAIVLVFANKQDFPGALDAAAISAKMDLDRLRQVWHLQVGSAVTGAGVNQGLDWLVKSMRKHPKF